MGCVSSKLLKKNLKNELLYGNGDFPNHVVSLTSSTYGVLKLEQEQIKTIKEDEDGSKVQVFGSKRVPQREELEVINAWELMGDLEEEIPISNQPNKTPFKCLIQVDLPKSGKKLGGKENKKTGQQGYNCNNNEGKRGKSDCYSTPKPVLKPWKLSSNSSNKLRKSSSFDSPRRSSSGGVLTSRRKSLSPLFDPELIDSIEKELCLSQQDEQIKKMVSPEKPKTPKSFVLVEKCPPGGENTVVIYTTTLRGIRKTFEDCNVVRSIIESYHIRWVERDISMDAWFKEELRKLMGTKEVKVPLVFVKGRLLVGGAEEVVKLEDEGKLEGLFDGIPKKGMRICQGCGGIRFIMCRDCCGSCKVLDENEDKMVKCGVCNENGLVQCPICC